MTSRTVLLAIAVAGSTCGIASATVLNLSLKSHPDVQAINVNVTYTSGSLTLNATGLPLTYEDDGLVSTSPHMIFGGNFTINLLVNNAGVATGGTLSISGAIPSLAIANQTLLTGDIDQFGYTKGVGAGRLEFVFDNLGGFLSPQYLSEGPVAGVIINGLATFPGNFTSSWNSVGAVADTAPLIPAPASGLVLLAGVAAMRRRRSS